MWLQCREHRGGRYQTRLGREAEGVSTGMGRRLLGEGSHNLTAVLAMGCGE